MPNESSICRFSDEEPAVYRYSLEHRFDDDVPSYARKTVAWVCLNPSTADQSQLDPTLRRCRAFSKRLGAGGMVILNLFALRATDPKVMLAAVDPIGPLNDSTILKVASREDITHVIAGWGVHGAHRARDKEMIQMMAGRLSCFGLTKAGFPRHPLYLRADAPLVPFGDPIALST